jgi:hypothetical protein
MIECFKMDGEEDSIDNIGNIDWNRNKNSIIRE